MIFVKVLVGLMVAIIVIVAGYVAWGMNQPFEPPEDMW